MMVYSRLIPVTDHLAVLPFFAEKSQVQIAHTSLLFVVLSERRRYSGSIYIAEISSSELGGIFVAKHGM